MGSLSEFIVMVEAGAISSVLFLGYLKLLEYSLSKITTANHEVCAARSNGVSEISERPGSLRKLATDVAPK